MSQHLAPDFIGIGAPRCGTRWLARVLGEHPEVGIGRDEVYFFTRRRVVHSFWDRGREWYDQQLRGLRREGTKVIGEITPVYLFDDDTPGLIQQVAPRAKLICCVRDQSRRAESWYRLFLRFNPTLTAENYPIDKFLTYQNDVFGREGFYLEHLERYWRLFPRDQLLVLVFDDLELDPLAYARRVFGFLGIDDAISPASASHRINRLAPEVRSVAVDGPKVGGPGTISDRPMVAAADSDGAVSHFRMSPQLRAQMRKLYFEHNRRLGDVLDRDLSHWNAEAT